eukprot:gene33813-40913_t
MFKSVFVKLFLLANVYLVWGKVQNLTPQMGWNSWNKFACNISESLIKETAEALISTGLVDLGYNYVNLDDCWQAAERDANGRVQEDSTRFPSGLKALGEYLHSKGLKFGIYSSAGFKTCQAFPASLGLEANDVSSYEEWGVDYLKYDNCYEDGARPVNRFSPMAQALQKSQREIFFSLCEWGRDNPAAWAPAIGGDSWRISGDIRDDWDSIISRAEISAPLWRYAGPNRGWNDPDMLEVGNGHCSNTEYMTHFSLWAVLKAPLLIGNDVRELAKGNQAEILTLLSNKEVIAINQDPLGRQARITWSDTKSYLPENHGENLVASVCGFSQPGLDSVYLDEAGTQDWVYTQDKKISNAATGLCLYEHPAVLDSSPNLGEWFNFTVGVRGVTALPCSSPDVTLWEVGKGVGGQVVSQSSGLCLEVSRLPAPTQAQGKRVQTSHCLSIGRPEDGARLEVGLSTRTEFDGTEHQSWTFPNGMYGKSVNKVQGKGQGVVGGMLNLYQRQCLTHNKDAMPGVQEEVWVGPLQDGGL